MIDPDIAQNPLLASLTWVDGQFEEHVDFMLEEGGEDRSVRATCYVDLKEQVFCKQTSLCVAHGDKKTNFLLSSEGTIGDVLSALNKWDKTYGKKVGTRVFSGLYYVGPGHWKANLHP